MNKFTQMGLSAALAFGVMAPASAFQTFSINAQSDGFAGIDATALEYLDFIGNSFVVNTFAGAPSIGAPFTFVDDGIFKVTGVDGSPQFSFGGSELTTIFHGAGTGTLGGSISFTSGTLSVYADSAQDYASANGIYGANNGTLIGTFDLTFGSGLINNDATPNGLITLEFAATSLAAGTWFDLSGNDLSLNPQNFAFVTSNASLLQTASATLTSELVCQGAGFNCPNGTPFSNTPLNFLVSNNGQYRTDTAQVPVPGSLALLGIGLFALGFRSKSYKNHK